MRRRKPSAPRRGLPVPTAGAVAAVFLLMPLFLLAGCASQRGLSADADYLNLLPQDADIYLSFPVQENEELAAHLVSSFAPYMERKEIDTLTKRFGSVYGAVKGGELYAVASGSFPKAGLGLVLTKKNGWTKTKDKAIPVTGKYYRYAGLPFQMAFPRSSVMMMAPAVATLLENYQEQTDGQFSGNSNPLSVFSHEQADGLALAAPAGGSIDFYVADVTATVAPFLKSKLFVSLPVTDLYGRFLPVDGGGEAEAGSDGRLYSFVGYMGLADPRAMRPALAALKILSRALGLDFEAAALDDRMVTVSGITVSDRDLGGLLKKMVP